MDGPSAKRRVTEQSAKQANLTCVYHFMSGTEEQRSQFRGVNGIGHGERFFQELGIVRRYDFEDCGVDLVEDATNPFRIGVATGIGLGLGPLLEGPQVVIGDQLGVFGQLSTYPQHGQTIFRDREMSHLPGEMRRGARRAAEPVLAPHVRQQLVGILSGKDDLLSGEIGRLV